MTDLTASSSPVLALAAEYRRVSGTAYQRGDDAQAAAYRDAAERLTVIAGTLPALPAPATRGA
jgi:hypothetical protein